MSKSFVLDFLLMCLAVLMLPLILTGATLYNLHRECELDNGHFVIEGATAWCRY